MQTPEKGTQFGDALVVHSLLFASIDRNCTIHHSPDNVCPDKRGLLCNLHNLGKLGNVWEFVFTFREFFIENTSSQPNAQAA